MTWRELNARVEAKGLADLPVGFIHIHGPRNEPSEPPDIFKNLWGALTVRNGVCHDRISDNQQMNELREIRNAIWVVEAQWDTPMGWTQWRTTVGIGLSRADGRNRLQEWKDRNPNDRFRLRCYRVDAKRKTLE